MRLLVGITLLNIALGAFLYIDVMRSRRSPLWLFGFWVFGFAAMAIYGWTRLSRRHYDPSAHLAGDR